MKCCTRSSVLRPLLFLLLTWVLPSWCLIQRQKDNERDAVNGIQQQVEPGVSSKFLRQLQLKEALHDGTEEQADNDLLERIIALAKLSKPAKGVTVKHWDEDSGDYVERASEATNQRQQTGTAAEHPGTDADHPDTVKQQRHLAVKQPEQTGTHVETLGQRSESHTQPSHDVEKRMPGETKRQATTNAKAPGHIPDPDVQFLHDVEKPLVVEQRQQTGTKTETLAQHPETEAYYSYDVEEPLVVKGRQQTWTYADNFGDHMDEDLEKPLGSPDEIFDARLKSADTSQDPQEGKQQSHKDAETLIKGLGGPKRDDIVFDMFEHGGSRRVQSALEAARSLGYDENRIKQVLFGKPNSSQLQADDQARADAKVLVQHFEASDGNALNDFLVEIFTYGGSERVRHAMTACKALGFSAARISAMLDSKALIEQLPKGDHERKGHRTLAEFAKALASVRPDKKVAENALVHLVRLSKPAPAPKASATDKKDQDLQQAQRDSLSLGKYLRSSDKHGLEDLLVEMYDQGGAQRVKAAEEYSNALGYDMHAYQGLLER